VGAKARKGFGSFADPPNLQDLTLEACRELAGQFRALCGVTPHASAKSATSALESRLTIEDTQTSWQDCWYALDQLGFSMQAFAQQHKHNTEKKALGLPRKIHGPSAHPLSNQTSWRAPENLESPKGDRHASPVYYHFAKGTNGNLIIRIIAFPAAYLPSLDVSSAFLNRLLTHLSHDLVRRTCTYADRGQGSVTVSVSTAQSQASRGGGLTKRQSGTPVMVRIVAVRPKGGYEVQEEGKPKGTLVVGTSPSPPPKDGDHVQVLIHDDNPRNPQYRWGTPSTGRERPSGPNPGRPQSRGGPQPQGGPQRRR